ncbi:Carotene biosynthesis-related CBR [Micractinium conductrix]|uniref:Carotene biosynthesis-related CBR n=1 Tax=Micractinium conductrix TaxID=554055 RepID=A0A2P6V9F1_9CHLO|nr:Carotene biosynthesis-related CBR [Micractinium conductrix]|eukprot:PSC70712.1 Carotene biosynthesis-related CBR [Micractinium conductrix]
MVAQLATRSSALVAARPAARVSTRSSTRFARRAVLVRAEAPETPAEAAPVVESAPEASAPTTAPFKPAPALVPTINFGDIMGFSGAAPELINGRLAMLGFTAALGAELASGRDVFQQLSGGMPILVIWAAMIFTGASLTPILKNAKRESFLFFTPEREMFNGRAAMIGFAALLIVEAVKGSALF